MSSTRALNLRAEGFTLIEVIVTVAIIGILTAIAIPSYTDYVRRSNRSDVKTQLLQAQLFMQRAFSQNSVYPDDLPVSLKKSPADGAAQNYAISVVTEKGGMGYVLTATPVNTMTGDECGNFVLTNAGDRKLVGNSGGKTAENCWR